MHKRTLLLATTAPLLLVSCLGGGGEMFEAPASAPGACAVEGNLVQNCGFDYDGVGWEVDATSCEFLTSECLSGSGCMELRRDARESHPNVSLSQCLLIAPGKTYLFAAHLHFVTGVADYCEIGVQGYATSDCSGFSSAGSLVFEMFQPADSWAQSPVVSVDTGQAWENNGPELQSVRIGVSCRGDSGLTVRFDDFVLSLTP